MAAQHRRDIVAAMDAEPYISDLDALRWQIELGADEAIGDMPVNRLDQSPPPQDMAPALSPTLAAAADTVGMSTQGHAGSQPPVSAPNDAGAAAIAAAATDLEALHAAMAAFDGCPLKRGARNTVFADGNHAARVMIVGEAPGREEDRQGKPFVGASGQLLDLMLAAIGLSRDSDDPATGAYITNVLPWRPPQNRDPSTDEALMMKAFLFRHIELAEPEVLITMGNAATKTILDTATGITRMRGNWGRFRDIPVLPMFHPAALLRNPLHKREAWADLLSLKSRLDATT